MISVKEAQEKLWDAGKTWRPLYHLSDCVPIEEAVGRVLAEPALAPLSLPPFDNSAMDGFALRSDRTQSASPAHPMTLAIAGEVRAGEVPPSLPDGASALRIMTGAAIPEGANAVIPKEDVEASNTHITLLHPVAPGLHIRSRGEDLTEGDAAISAGTVLGACQIALLASLGMRNIPVSPLPRVAILATGSELKNPGDALAQGQIFNSNSFFLSAALKQLGMEPVETHAVSDDPRQLEKTLRSAMEKSDLILSTGGVSVGESDFMRPLFEKVGATPLFWKVAQKPGKPLYAGKSETHLFVGLPGNPFAVMSCYTLYVYPLLLSMMGADPHTRPPRWAKLAKDCRKEPGRSVYLKGKTLWEGDTPWVIPLPKQGSHLLAAFGEADCLIALPPEDRCISTGTAVSCIPLP